MKLKLNTSTPSSAAATPLATPTATTPGGAKFKIKLKTSQPPTPAEEVPPAQPLGPPPTKPKRPYNKKPKNEDGSSSKRAADSNISPAPKRPQISPPRRPSVKFGSLKEDDDIPTPTSAGPKIKIGRRQSTGPKQILLTAKKRPPQRPVGVGYDSEASDAETDPAIEQQFVLRMAPGEDSEYLRSAIENRTMGLRPEEGGADVSFRFLDRELRRSLVTVRGRRYAAILVDLPCIVEGMKSWDKRGWWKVADIAQMLLVLGPCTTEAEAKDYALPREVDKNTFAYAHGLTPPMHWVRKRRFRRRVSYKDVENVEEEVERLLKEDAACLRAGGDVSHRMFDRDARPSDMMAQDGFEDDGYVESTEDAYGQALPADEDEDAEGEEDDFDDDELEANMAAAMMEGDDDDEGDTSMVPADAARSLGAVMAAEREGLADARGAREASSDEDESSDEDMDTIDEDAIVAQNELDKRMADLQDLEREVANKRVDVERLTNQLLKTKAKAQLKALEDELAMKRMAFGIDVDE